MTTHPATGCIYRLDYEFICLHSVVGLDRNFGLHRLRRYCPSLGCRASIRDTNSDFVCNYGLSKRWYM